MTDQIHGSSHSELRTDDLCVHFEGIRAVDDVDLTLTRGEILGLIGPNGAGKTTFVNALTGFQRPTRGAVWIDDHEVTGKAPQELVHAGVVRTFQGARLFSNMTTLENVEAACLAVGSRRRAAISKAHSLLQSLHLEHRASQLASSLPHGEARRLAIARALASSPKFLLLDEPAAGLNEAESADLVDSLRLIHAETGAGLLVIEHDMDVVMNLCQRVHVLNYGRTLAVGTPDEIRADERVIGAYLGGAVAG